MRRVFKYGFFQGMSPLCPRRLSEYPELSYIADLTPEQLRSADRGDLEDAQHQWAYTSTPVVMQRCFEDGCDAVRPTPMYGLPEQDQMFLLQELIRHSTV